MQNHLVDEYRKKKSHEMFLYFITIVIHYQKGFKCPYAQSEKEPRRKTQYIL